MKKQLLIFLVFACIGLNTNAQNNYLPAFFTKGAGHVTFSKPGRSSSTAMFKTGNVFKPGKQINFTWDNVANAWNYQDSIINSYNSSGNTAMMLDYSPGSTNPGKTVYFYNAGGKETSDTTYSWNGSSYGVNNCTTYSYDTKGYIIQQLRQSWSGTSWTKDYEDDFTYDVNNNQTEELQYYSWNGTGWDYGNKTDMTWISGQMTQQISQNWTGTAWINGLKFDYTYAGGQLNGGTGSTWNGTGWQNEFKLINVVWYQWSASVLKSKLASYTEQVPNGTGWKDSIIVNITYDSFGNQTDNLEQAKPATAYITSREQKNIYQYDANNNITQDIEQDWIDATTGLRNYTKKEYNNYQSFTVGLATINSNDIAFTLFPNPSTGIFNLQSAKHTFSNIVIYNLVGEKIYQSSVNTLQTTIDLSAQPKGIYFVQVSDENKKVVNRKIIVQ